MAALIPDRVRTAVALLLCCAAGAAIAMPGVARAQQTTLQVVWMGWPDQQVLPLMAEFEKRNPTIKLAVERMPFSQIFQALEVRLNARNNDPDIYIVDSPLTASYASRGDWSGLASYNRSK